MFLPVTGNIHAASNPEKTTFNITPPHHQNCLFLGGIFFLEFFHEFLGLGHKKIFWKDFGKNPMFWNNYRPIPATYVHFVILGNSKSLGFSVFWDKFGNFFFFKIQFWAKLALEPLTMILLTFFRFWRWFILIFDVLCIFLW